MKLSRLVKKKKKKRKLLLKKKKKKSTLLLKKKKKKGRGEPNIHVYKGFYEINVTLY